MGAGTWGVRFGDTRRSHNGRDCTKLVGGSERELVGECRHRSSYDGFDHSFLVWVRGNIWPPRSRLDHGAHALYRKSLVRRYVRPGVAPPACRPARPTYAARRRRQSAAQYGVFRWSRLGELCSGVGYLVNAGSGRDCTWHTPNRRDDFRLKEHPTLRNRACPSVTPWDSACNEVHFCATDPRCTVAPDRCHRGVFRLLAAPKHGRQSASSRILSVAPGRHRTSYI